TRHHLFRESHNVGDPLRSDPVTGDVYVEIFEAQYQQLLADLAENRKQAEEVLQRRVDPQAWQGLDTAPRFDLPALLADAAHQDYTASRAHHGLVTHIREQAGGDRPLVLTVGPEAQTRQYRATLEWAVRTMTADLRSAYELDPGALLMLGQYEERLTRADNRLTDGLFHPVEEEITDVIAEVHRVHALRRDNKAGAPAALPPEAAMSALDPVFVARDVAHELGAHIRLDVRQPDGTVRSHWADPAGRVYAFDPVTFDDAVLTADQATRAGLWTDDLRRLAVAHGFDPVDLARFYRTSWQRGQTFAQAVTAAIAERRAHLAAVRPSLPGLFDRALEAVAGWQEAVARLEPEHVTAERDRARARAELTRVTDRLEDLETERVRLALDGGPDPTAPTRIRDLTSPLEAERDRLQGVLDGHDAAIALLTGRLEDVRGRAAEAEQLLDDLRAIRNDTTSAGQARWTEQAVRAAGERLTAPATPSAGPAVGPQTTGDLSRSEQGDHGVDEVGTFDWHKSSKSRSRDCVEVAVVE
ncbi:hypothetical protein AB0L00_38695, partial [Actinoallomurus sp. NPDC052308]|uniref:hypothetical protein n=1 Tax=Actinoallomurus sp. NPDC052308 TaxID=3155530 RepID=UPI00341B59AD